MVGLRQIRKMVTLSLLVSVAGLQARGQGIVAPAAGPINQSMAGASVAAPVDLGSSYWNPANLSGLEQNEFLLGSNLIFPSIHYSGSIPAGAIAPNTPPQNRFGTSRSDSGVGTGLAVGLSFKLREDSPLTAGMLVTGLVGGNVNFPGSFTTPTLGPRRPPQYFGFGSVYANTALLGIHPMLSAQVSDRLAIGMGPVITTGTAQFNPAFFAPGPPDEFGVTTFPAATNQRPFWGAGFQLGALYELNENWNVGFSYKSKIWQERWSYNSAFPDLSPRRIGLQADVPSIYSLGVAYKGIERALIDVDVRYFDYDNAALWGQSVPDGGLGWGSIWSVATGAQYELTERVTLRGGYLYNMNPVPDVATLFNIQAPAITQHTLSLGMSMKLTESITSTLGWSHSFRNTIEGPIAQIPQSGARLDAQIDQIFLGFNVQYGGVKKNAGNSCQCGNGIRSSPGRLFPVGVPSLAVLKAT